jgi:hypothetical protein
MLTEYGLWYPIPREMCVRAFKWYCCLLVIVC